MKPERLLDKLTIVAVVLVSIVPIAPTRATADSSDPQPAHVLAVGDSVMLGAAGALERMIDGIEVDAAVGRQVTTGIDILRARAAAGQLPEVIVIDLGTNGAMTAQQFDDIMALITGERRVVFVNIRAPRPWEASTNAVLADGVQPYPNTVLVDWYAATADHPELLWDDGIHLRSSGAEIYSQLVAPVAAAPLLLVS